MCINYLSIQSVSHPLNMCAVNMDTVSDPVLGQLSPEAHVYTHACPPPFIIGVSLKTFLVKFLYAPLDLTEHFHRFQSKTDGDNIQGIYKPE